MRTVPWWILLPLLAAPLSAQLRRKLPAADHVLTVRQTDDGRYQTVEILRGTPPDQLPAPDGDLPPSAEPIRLLCLTERDGACRVTWNVPATPSTVELAQTLLASERGRASVRTASDLVRIVLRGKGTARHEACTVLLERPVLRDAINNIARETMLLVAVGETEDLALKESIATLCAEAGQRNVVEALCVTLQSIDDPEVARAIGRIARRIHGDAAIEVLQPFLRQARGAMKKRLRLAVDEASARS